MEFLTINDLKEYAKITGNSIHEVRPQSILQRTWDYYMNQLEIAPDLSDWDEQNEHTITIRFKVKSYEFRVYSDGTIGFVESWNGNTGKVIKGFEEGYSVEKRIAKKLNKKGY